MEFFKANALITLDGMTCPTLRIKGDAKEVRDIIKMLIDNGTLIDVNIYYYTTFERTEE